MSEQLTADTMKLNEVEPEGFTSEPRSLFYEVTKMREALLLLCDLQRELTKKVEAAMGAHPVNEQGPAPSAIFRTQEVTTNG